LSERNVDLKFPKTEERVETRKRSYVHPRPLEQQHEYIKLDLRDKYRDMMMSDSMAVNGVGGKRRATRLDESSSTGFASQAPNLIYRILLIIYDNCNVLRVSLASVALNGTPWMQVAKVAISYSCNESEEPGNTQLDCALTTATKNTARISTWQAAMMECSSLMENDQGQHRESEARQSNTADA